MADEFPLELADRLLALMSERPHAGDWSATHKRSIEMLRCRRRLADEFGRQRGWRLATSSAFGPATLSRRACYDGNYEPITFSRLGDLDPIGVAAVAAPLALWRISPPRRPWLAGRSCWPGPRGMA